MFLMLMNIQELHAQWKPIIIQRLQEFARKKTDEELFYELCFCIMAVQTKGRKADLVAKELQKKNYYTRAYNLLPLLKQHVRFHNNKARYLEAAKKDFMNIKEILQSNMVAEEKRALLVNNVKGFGYKEASHYLRNTGHRNLAILDRHILRNLQTYKVIKEIPSSLTTKKYLQIEQQFKTFSQKIRIPMDELDLAFWASYTGEVFK